MATDTKVKAEAKTETKDTADAPQSDPIARVTQALETIEATCTKAERQAEEGKALRDFRASLTKVLSVEGDDALSILSAMGEAGTKWVESFDALTKVRDALTSEGATDSDQAQEAVAMLKGALGMGMFDLIPNGADLKAKATGLMDRFSKLPTTTKARGTGPGTKSLGFYVRWSCNVDGCDWKGGRSDKDNLNSHRNECKKHAKDKHSTSVESGGAWSDAVTKAFKAVMEGTSNRETGETITVEKVA